MIALSNNMYGRDVAHHGSTLASRGSSWIDNQLVDPKVPSMTGYGGNMEVKAWAKAAKAYALSQGSKEKEASVGNKLLLNLRGEAARLVEDQLDPSELVDDDNCYDDVG